MAIKTISQFDAATPASNDKILFEQNGEGKSAAIGDVGKAIGINRDVLWLNASPNSPFVAQELIIDRLSKYNHIEIYFKIYLDRKYGSCIAEPSFAGILTGIGTDSGEDFNLLGRPYISCRPFFINPDVDKIDFYDAAFVFIDSNTFTADNGACVPTYICGVR